MEMHAILRQSKPTIISHQRYSNLKTRMGFLRLVHIMSTSFLISIKSSDRSKSTEKTIDLETRFISMDFFLSDIVGYGIY